MNLNNWYHKALRVLGFILSAFVYLFVGYHIRDYIIDFSDFSYIQHPGILEEEYAKVDQMVSVITTSDRWLTNIVVLIVLMLSASTMLFFLFWNKRYFFIGILGYSALIFIAILFIVVGEGVSDNGIGYDFARFLKDNFIHTPFVFTLFAASLKAFRI